MRIPMVLGFIYPFCLAAGKADVEVARRLAKKHEIHVLTAGLRVLDRQA